MTVIKNGINYVAADEGGLVFTIMTDEGEIKRRADDINDGVYWVNEYGIASNLLYCTSMFFGLDHFFEGDLGPEKMFEQIANEAAYARMMGV